MNEQRKHKRRDTTGVLETNDLEAADAEFCERMVASAAGLPRICVLKKCRRRNLCLGRKPHDLFCLRHHKGLFQARLHSGLKRLGWSMEEEEGSGQ